MGCGQVIGILESFTERTPGSFLEMKDSCLSWHYRDADPDFGMTQAKNLHQHLDQVLCRVETETHTHTDNGS